MTEAPTLAAALLAIQQERPSLLKDKEGAHGAKYISIDSLFDKILPIVNAHGVVLSQHPTHVDGRPALLTRLWHAPSGEKDESVMLLMVTKEDPQAQGSGITYARRYAACAALGLTPDDDDDGQRAAGGRAEGQLGETHYPGQAISDRQRAVIWGRARGADISNELLYRIVTMTSGGKTTHPDGVSTRRGLDAILAALDHFAANQEEDMRVLEAWEAEHTDVAGRAGDKPLGPGGELPADPSPVAAGSGGDDEDGHELPF